MDWIQIFTIIGSNIVLFIWARTEASLDRRELASIAASDRRDILQMIQNIQSEMKDFHGRLIAIEERNKK